MKGPQGVDALEPRTEAESFLRDNYRLACQAKVADADASPTTPSDKTATSGVETPSCDSASTNLMEFDIKGISETWCTLGEETLVVNQKACMAKTQTAMYGF